MQQVKHFPFATIVVVPKCLKPICQLALHSAVQQILERRRQVEVLVNHEGHLVMHVVDQFEPSISNGPHRIIHGNFMQVLTGKYFIPTGAGFLVQYRQQAFPPG